MYGVIVKQGSAVRLGFGYICLFKNPIITILKVVGGEDCVRENVSYHNVGLGAKPPAPGQFLQYFWKKQPF